MEVKTEREQNVQQAESKENSNNDTLEEKDKKSFKPNFQIRLETLSNKFFRTSIKFKNSHKRELGLDIRRNFSTAIGCINLGMKVPSVRKIRLQEAQAEIETARHHFELLKEAKGISSGFWREIDLEITNISRSIGAYIKQIGKKK